MQCPSTCYGNNTILGGLVFPTGVNNTAIGFETLHSNITGNGNTAIGSDANVSAGNLTNATAIGFTAVVNNNNKVRLGNTAVTVIEGQVAFSAVSDETRKETSSRSMENPTPLYSKREQLSSRTRLTC